MDRESVQRVQARVLEIVERWGEYGAGGPEGLRDEPVGWSGITEAECLDLLDKWERSLEAKYAGLPKPLVTYEVHAVTPERQAELIAAGTLPADCTDVLEGVRTQQFPEQAPTRSYSYIYNSPSVEHGLCCRVHGCKYREVACPVVAGTCTPRYECEACNGD